MAIHNAAYTLKGYGQINPVWVRAFLQLFRQHKVNIRKLVLLKDAHPECFSLLEVQFVSPGEDYPAFWGLLETCLRQQCWEANSLIPLPEAVSSI